MDIEATVWLGLLAAMGGGLLVGIERERRKGKGVRRSAIGMRTCLLASMTGAVAILLGDVALCVAGLGIVALALTSYWHSHEADPGLTTELALIACYLLGALAMSHAQLAAALFVSATIALSRRDWLHRFARQVLSEDELNDALLLAASILIVMPLLPDRTIDPSGVLNPRLLWMLVILMMAINAVGHVALRTLGPSRGLALSGFLGGFVSSTATIAGMAQRARAHPTLRLNCIAGALLSNIATIVQLALVLLAVSPELLRHLALPLGVTGTSAVAVASIAIARTRQSRQQPGPMPIAGHAFSLRHALLFAGVVAVALLASATLRQWLGVQGVVGAAAATGFADVHAAAVALGRLVWAGGISADQATWALFAAFATNSLVKCAAAVAGGRAYALAVGAGIAVLNLAFLIALRFVP